MKLPKPLKVVLLLAAATFIAIWLAPRADGQTLKATAKPVPPLSSLIAEPQGQLSVELNGKKAQMTWSLYEYEIGNVKHKDMVFYKPGTGEDWIHYESTNETVGKEADGKPRIRHWAKIIWLRKVGIPVLKRDVRYELIAEYTGFSIDESMHLFCEKLEDVLGLSMPAGFEL